MKIRCAFLVITAGLCASAPAQTQWFMELDRPWVTPANPTVTIRLSAGFPPQYLAFAAGRFDLHATEPGWSNGAVLLAPPSNPGVISGPSITGITGGQVHFPPIVIADPTNPLPLYELQWTATEFSRRTIEFDTLTSQYVVYTINQFPTSKDLVRELTEGHGQVRVVPAPAGAAILGLAAIVGMRRRRDTHRQEAQR